jgi:pimeloyl-ACP methyl ester carboxylesterase
MEPPPVVILVHGAWHGPWAWEAVAALLAAEGIRNLAVDLPSKGSDPAVLGDLHDDARVVRAAVEAAQAPALVVAHSYGGLPVSEGLAESVNAAHLIYLAAFMLVPGESLLGVRGGVEPDWWLTSGDGRTILPDDPLHRFYADCPPEVAERAAAAILPQRKDTFRQELRAAAWQRVPSTYVVCTRDNAVPTAAQERMSARAGTVSHIDSSHSPFLSRPGEVTAIIQETLAAVVAGAD